MCGNVMSAPLPAIVPAARKATAAVSGGGWGSEGPTGPAGDCPSRGVGAAGRWRLGWVRGRRGSACAVWGPRHRRGRAAGSAPPGPLHCGGSAPRDPGPAGRDGRRRVAARFCLGRARGECQSARKSLYCLALHSGSK